MARALSNLGSFTIHRGSVQVARRYFERAAAILSASQGEDHPETLRVRASWADSLRRGGEHPRAVEEASRVMSDAKSVDLTAKERATLQSVLGMALFDAGQLERALEVFEVGGALPGAKEDLAVWFAFQHQIAAVLHRLGRLEEAYRVGRQAWSKVDASVSRHELALLLSQLEVTRRDYREALPLAKIARNGVMPWTDPEGRRRAELDEWIEQIEQSMLGSSRVPRLSPRRP